MAGPSSGHNRSTALQQAFELAQALSLSMESTGELLNEADDVAQHLQNLFIEDPLAAPPDSPTRTAQDKADD
jgi:hypothetical protein